MMAQLYIVLLLTLFALGRALSLQRQEEETATAAAATTTTTTTQADTRFDVGSRALASWRSAEQEVAREGFRGHSVAGDAAAAAEHDDNERLELEAESMSHLFHRHRHRNRHRSRLRSHSRNQRRRRRHHRRHPQLSNNNNNQVEEQSLQVPEQQMSVVVSSSDNSYVSASPIEQTTRTQTNAILRNGHHRTSFHGHHRQRSGEESFASNSVLHRLRPSGQKRKESPDARQPWASSADQANDSFRTLDGYSIVMGDDGAFTPPSPSLDSLFVRTAAELDAETQPERLKDAQDGAQFQLEPLDSSRLEQADRLLVQSNAIERPQYSRIVAGNSIQHLFHENGRWRDTRLASIRIGQEVSVSPSKLHLPSQLPPP